MCLVLFGMDGHRPDRAITGAVLWPIADLFDELPKGGRSPNCPGEISDSKYLSQCSNHEYRRPEANQLSGLGPDRPNKE